MQDRGISDVGRVVYGAGAVTLGLVGVASGDFATIWHPVPPDVPGRQALAYLAAVCLVAAGAATCRPRTARAGASVLAALYLAFAALWVRRVVGFPQLYGTWGGMLEQLVPAIGGGVIALAPNDDDSARAARAAEIGRMLLGVCALSFGVTHFTAVSQTAAMVPAWMPRGQRFWAIATGACDLLAGLALLSGVAATLAARLLTAMLLGFGAFVWAPQLLAGPVPHNVWGGNAINLVIAGAVWVVADAIARRQRDTRTRPRLMTIPAAAQERTPAPARAGRVRHDGAAY